MRLFLFATNNEMLSIEILILHVSIKFKKSIYVFNPIVCVKYFIFIVLWSSF